MSRVIKKRVACRNAAIVVQMLQSVKAQKSLPENVMLNTF